MPIATQPTASAGIIQRICSNWAYPSHSNPIGSKRLSIQVEQRLASGILTSFTHQRGCLNSKARETAIKVEMIDLTYIDEKTTLDCREVKQQEIVNNRGIEPKVKQRIDQANESQIAKRIRIGLVKRRSDRIISNATIEVYDLRNSRQTEARSILAIG